MTMLLRCAPILLLQQDFLHNQSCTTLVNKRCARFLLGEWQFLFQTALDDIQLHNEILLHQSKKSTRTIKPKSNSKLYTRVLQQARDLNYSRALNLLRSPGLSGDSPDEIYSKLQALHPTDSAPLQQPIPEFSIPMSAFNFINGKLIGKMIRRAKRGTAVDQWGWDSREMWRDILADPQFLEIVAQHWILPIAAGYLPARYREHLAGGRLVALSKHPKPGIRPINVTDAWRRIAAKTLLSICLPDFKSFFQNSHPRVFQFSTATPDGAATMFHIINAIINSTTKSCMNQKDLFILLTLDIKNAFNTLSRQSIFDFYSKRCPSTNSEPNTWSGWDILWKHFEAHYGTTGLLKFYHSGKTYTVESTTGTQQGDPLGGVLFTAPLQPLFNQVADAFPAILICVFADNTVFLGPTSQTLAAADLFNNLLTEQNLQLNATESNILHTNTASSFPIPTTMTTEGGLEFPCTIEGIKLLGSPIGNPEFCLEIFGKTISKIEADHILLKDFPYWHQRLKLLIFNVNTRINYFLRTTAPFLSEPLTTQLDHSVDQFLAHTLHFPADFQTCQESLHYQKALKQMRLGIRDGGSGCFNNVPMIAPASYSAIATTLKWLHAHPIDFSWLPEPLSQTLDSFLIPNINSLQQWNLPVAATCPTTDICDKKTLPLQIPSPQCLIDWPQRLFPTQGDFGRHIKKQLVSHFLRPLTVLEKQRFTSIARHTLKLSLSSHLLPSQAASTNLWQCSTSLFSLTCFYELSNQAFLTTAALLLDIPVPHALYLRDTQPAYSTTDIWADALLNKSAHASDTRNSTHALFAQELTQIANSNGIPSTCVESRLPFRDEGTTKPTRKRADMMTLTGCGISPNAQYNFSKDTRLIMDVTIGHIYDSKHNYKPDNLQNMAGSKCFKYARHYRRQRLAFAPIVANSLGQFGADTLQLLWNLADHQATTSFGFAIDVDDTQTFSSPPSTQQTIDYRRLRGLKYHENRLRLLTCVFECVTTRIIGQTFNLTCSSEYHRWLDNMRHNWLPSLPSYDLSQHPVAQMTSPQDSQTDPTSSPSEHSMETITTPSHNDTQSQISQIEPHEDTDLEVSISAPLHPDDIVHDPSSLCGLRRTRSLSTSSSFASDRPSQRARVAHTTLTAGTLTGLPPGYPWISDPVLRHLAPSPSNPLP